MCVSRSSGLPICNGYHRFCQRADCQAKKKSGCKLSLLIPLYFSFLTSLQATQPIYPAVSLLIPLFYSPSNKSTHYWIPPSSSYSLTFFSIPLHLSFSFYIVLGWSSALIFSLTAPLITHHTNWEREMQPSRQAEGADSQKSWDDEFTAERCGHPGSQDQFQAFLWLHDKRGLGKCLGEADINFTDSVKQSFQGDLIIARLSLYFFLREYISIWGFYEKGEFLSQRRLSLLCWSWLIPSVISQTQFQRHTIDRNICSSLCATTTCLLRRRLALRCFIRQPKRPWYTGRHGNWVFSTFIYIQSYYSIW